MFSAEELESALQTIDMLVFKFRPYAKIYESNVMGNTYEIVKTYLNFQKGAIYSLHQVGIIDLENFKHFGEHYYKLMMEALKIYAQQNNY